jgi:hypothetical protein
VSVSGADAKAADRRKRQAGRDADEEDPSAPRVTAQSIEAQLDWRERADDDLVLALAIATWQAERDPGLGFSCSYGVSEMDGWGGI